MDRRALPQTEIPAQALAVMVAANGRVDEREMRVLDALDAFGKLGVSRDRFVELARCCAEEIGSGLSGRSWLTSEEVQAIDSVLDAVTDPEQQRLICRLAAAAIAASNGVTHDERLVYHHVLARWHVCDEESAAARGECVA